MEMKVQGLEHGNAHGDVHEDAQDAHEPDMKRLKSNQNSSMTFNPFEDSV